MRIIAFVLSLMISFNLCASETGVRALSHLVDEYHYSLTVEWDQQDKAAFKKINDEYRVQIEQLLQKESISKEELTQFYEARVQDKKVLEGLKAQLAQLPANPSSDELFAFFQNSKALYSQGASWVGDVLIVAGAGLFVIGFLYFIISAIIEAGKTCEDEGGTTVVTEVNCGIRSVCVSYGESYCYAYQDKYQCDEKKECVY